MADQNSPARKPYSSDLTPDQWDIVRPMVPPNTGRGRRQTLSLKDIIDAIFYINANGCKWADLPHDFPSYTSVSYHYTKWMRDGTWRRINDALRAAVRDRAGRDPHPSAGAVDRQTATAAPTGGHRGTTAAREPPGGSGTSASIPWACWSPSGSPRPAPRTPTGRSARSAGCPSSTNPGSP